MHEQPTRDLLIEIGTEELPPKVLDVLSEALAENLIKDLEKAGIIIGQVQRYATPRRLAVLIREVPESQPDQKLEKRGPAITAAFDADGKPTKAAQGFARSCGVEPNELQIIETEKGAWLGFIKTEPGAQIADLIPGLLENALASLPIPKRMRWGVGEAEFVRPVHWVVLLFGNQIIPATILGVKTGNETRGHRFHCPNSILITTPADYAALLESQGRVIADFARRREAVRSRAEAAAAEVGGRAVIDPALLDEVTALVEWPIAVLGNFDSRFLDVPPEALVTTLQNNQKCFPIVDQTNRLMPHFIATSNLESIDPRQVQAGYERVIRPRFSDAEFFWNKDRKNPLSDRLEMLKTVVFQQRLGTLYEKSARTAELAHFIADRTNADSVWAERAAWLSKCDLLTEMVQEFPELQGIMGRYYALHDGEPEEVALAQEEQYCPRFAGDAIPATDTGRALAVADRIDTLIGIFAIGQAPSGAKDPFGLRRSALGVLRIIIEGGLDLDLQKLLEHAASRFNPALKADTAVTPVLDFILERLRSYYLEQGFRPDEFEAVLDLRPTRIMDFDRRIQAVAEFRRLPEAESLAAANKRIRNILKKVNGALPEVIRSDLFEHEAEQALAKHLEALSIEVGPLLEQGRYRQALTRLADLREPVDSFFDQVMVMAEDPALRDNRIAMLNQMSNLFLRVADLSRLQS